ncbi:MAG: 30S ribosomal protein S16 [Bacteroidetes bacterium]|nr:30S ribosomal protein S16 [Bacteroidota bacterium]
MPTKIRLQRYGKKAHAYFHIVIADGRAPRDGKFIEKIGSYNPNTNPATIEIDSEKAFEWLKKGAQPSDTCRAILSYKGIMYRNHLYRGVQKGAITQEQADAKLEKWLQEKQAKIDSKISKLADAETSSDKSRLDAEKTANEARRTKIAAKATAKTEAPAAETTEAPAAPAENTENA